MTARVSNRQTFPVSAKTYWSELWLNVPFLERLYTERLGCKKVEVVQQQGDLERGLRRVLRLHKLVGAPGPVQKVLGEVMLLEEHSEFNPATNVWSYRMVPERLADRLKVSGRFTLKENAQGVEEITEGEMEFAMFGVGSLVEAFMVREDKQSHAQRIAFMQQYIADKALGSEHEHQRRARADAGPHDGAT